MPSKKFKLEVSELTPQQRAGLVIYLLCQLIDGTTGLTTKQVSEKVGLSMRGTRAMLHNLEGTEIPLYQDDLGQWHVGL